MRDDHGHKAEERMNNGIARVDFSTMGSHPAIRVFFQGCQLKCSYCHNPDLRYHNDNLRPVELVSTQLSQSRDIGFGGSLCVELLGGEPFYYKNNPVLEDVIALCQDARVKVFTNAVSSESLYQHANGFDVADTLCELFADTREVLFNIHLTPTLLTEVENGNSPLFDGLVWLGTDYEKFKVEFTVVKSSLISYPYDSNTIAQIHLLDRICVTYD